MKKNIYLMYVIALMHGMVFYGPIAALYRQSQGVTIFQISLIESISLVLCLLCEIPWGILADKIGYKRTMVFCCFLYFVSKIVFWRADGFLWFLAERIMLSIVIAGLSGVDASILYLSCEGKNSQKVFGIYNSLQTAGLLGAAAVFSVFAGDNYRLAGFLTVVSYGIAALASLWLVEVKNNQTHAFCITGFRKMVSHTLKDRHLLLFLAAVAFLTETHQTITVFLIQLQYMKCGLSVQQIGYVYIAVTLTGLCGAASSCLSRRSGIKYAGILLYVMAVLSCFALAFTEKAWVTIGSVLILRISNSLFQPFQMELQNRQILSENRATALSINAMIADTVGAGTNLVFGILADSRLSSAFLFGSFLCMAGLMMFIAWHRNWIKK
ncbi:MFS transporter [Clostridium transplantifaecale]|uniref:MFS transporter n=1 Tax=Clostridium transplantifaecale TaxID=2479838 RepID=UPI000F63B083|nr:MFS transporter [Clostridium transplantifaecale]